MIGVPIGLWLVSQLMPELLYGWDDAIVAIPWFGDMYARLFHPTTYYRIDTALMFQSAVHRAVLETVDELTEAKGVRALTESERKPILREFFER